MSSPLLYGICYCCVLLNDSSISFWPPFPSSHRMKKPDLICVCSSNTQLHTWSGQRFHSPQSFVVPGLLQLEITSACLTVENELFFCEFPFTATKTSCDGEFHSFTSFPHALHKLQGVPLYCLCITKGHELNPPLPTFSTIPTILKACFGFFSSQP